jgi:hypothetical protein
VDKWIDPVDNRLASRGRSGNLELGFDDARGEPMSEPEEIGDRVTRLEHEVARARDDAAAARVLAGGADRDVSAMQGELRAHTRSLNALRETQLEHGAAILGLRGDVGELRGDVGELRGDVGGLRGDVDELRDELRGDVGGLRGDVDELRGDVGGLRVDVGGLRGDVDELRGDVGGLRGEMREGFSKLAVSQARITALLSAHLGDSGDPSSD